MAQITAGSAVNSLHQFAGVSTGADTMTLTGNHEATEIQVHSTSACGVWVRFDGTAAVAGAADNYFVEVGGSIVLPTQGSGTPNTVCSVIGGTPAGVATAGAVYSVNGVN